MSDAFSVAATGLNAQQKALDTIANNIANVNTPAFKRAQIRFSDLVASVRQPEVDASDPSRQVSTSAGVAASTQLMLNQPGEIERTGNPMDVAVSGNGFVEVMGPGGQTLLWRGGSLRINEDGLLATSEGFGLLSGVTVPWDATALSISPDGTVSAIIDGETTATEIGQLGLVRIDDAASVDQLDDGYYRLRDGASAISGVAGEDGLGRFVQGAIEHSNVVLSDEMVGLMLVQRAYAANAQIVQAADQLMGVANGLRR
ncbi:flagellar hook-basal body protein [Sphingosinithalassobacter portus]|uniref:flagellar hook-basal body protein n=1 Tax=Stakelama portus TaxID=2676234 RepID=UPI000D6E055D|nr:flagellar hook basal-body protein [Sphingosinithalassobacter portus]